MRVTSRAAVEQSGLKKRREEQLRAQLGVDQSYHAVLPAIFFLALLVSTSYLALLAIGWLGTIVLTLGMCGYVYTSILGRYWVSLGRGWGRIGVLNPPFWLKTLVVSPCRVDETHYEPPHRPKVVFMSCSQTRTTS